MQDDDEAFTVGEVRRALVVLSVVWWAITIAAACFVMWIAWG
jgi:hypothetical protein